MNECMKEWVPNVVFHILKFMSHLGSWISHQDFYSCSVIREVGEQVRFEVSAAVLLRIQVFWEATLCCWDIAS
jgi:hypothetical protein